MHVLALRARLATASSARQVMHCALFIQHVDQFVRYSLHTKNNSESRLDLPVAHLMISSELLAQLLLTRKRVVVITSDSDSTVASGSLGGDRRLR